MAHYISAWTIFTRSLRTEIAKALDQGAIKADDIVWGGPSGDAIIAATPADLDEEYIEYTDHGLVSEYLD
jgi:hypothetical protein